MRLSRTAARAKLCAAGFLSMTARGFGSSMDQRFDRSPISGRSANGITPRRPSAKVRRILSILDRAAPSSPWTPTASGAEPPGGGRPRPRRLAGRAGVGRRSAPQIKLFGLLVSNWTYNSAWKSRLAFRQVHGLRGHTCCHVQSSLQERQRAGRVAGGTRLANTGYNRVEAG